MRILTVAACPFPFPRGTPVRVQRLAEGLARRGHDVHVVAYHLGTGEPSDGVRVSRIRHVDGYTRTAAGPSWAKLLVLDPLLAQKVGRVARTERPDVIHAHHYEGLVAAWAARAPGARLVYDAHTTLTGELPFTDMLPGRSFKRALGAALDRRLVRLPDGVAAVNKDLATLIADHRGSRDRVVPVPVGVDVSSFLEPRRRGRDDTTAPLLVYAGNLAPYQGVPAMLEALAGVADRIPGVRLRVVTTPGTEVTSLMAAAADLGVQERIEHRESDFRGLPDLLADADLAVHPRPPCAGTPLKLLNYMAAALPIVSFRGSAVTLEHESTGWLVPDGDVRAFACAILSVLEADDRGWRMGERARRAVVDRHSWNASAEAAEALFLEVAGRD